MNKFKPNITKIYFKKFRKNKYKIFKIRYNFYSMQCRLSFGKFGLISLENGFLESLQIEATRRTITKKLDRQGKL